MPLVRGIPVCHASLMTITAAPPAPAGDAPAARRPRWRRWAALVVVVLLVAGGLATFLALRTHYRDAPPLSCACGLGWAEPDTAHVRNVQAGPWAAYVVPARPGHVQAFEVLVVNTSSVTQTILGGHRDVGWTAEPVDVRFARPTGSSGADLGSKSASDFTATPAVLPPGGARWVRYAIHTAGGGIWSGSRTESFTGLDLKVRIGAWTRWQHIDFGHSAFVLSTK